MKEKKLEIYTIFGKKKTKKIWRRFFKKNIGGGGGTIFFSWRRRPVDPVPVFYSSIWAKTMP